MKKYLHFLFSIFAVVILSCAGKQSFVKPHVANKKTLPVIPAGVDSSLAHEARIDAAKFFVSLDKKQLSDSVYAYAKEYIEITEELYNQLNDKKKELEELKKSIKKTREEYKKKESIGLVDQRKLKKKIEKSADDSATIEIVFSLLKYYLDHSQESLEESCKLNRFDLNNYYTLARCYKDQGVIFNDSLGYRKSISQLEKFLRNNKGLYYIYSDISNAYFELKNWQKAYDYMCKAKEVFALTSYFNDEKFEYLEKYKFTKLPRNANPEEYYEVLKQKGYTELKVNEGDSALVTFNEALIFADSKADSNEIKNIIRNWILWDNKNIWTAERRSIINDSLISKNFKWAKEALLDLLPKLTKREARHEMEWRLSILQYNIFKEFEDGANRLYKVIVEADTAKKIKNFFQPPKDSLYKVYFRDCGQMFFDLGNKFRSEGMRDKAEKYFAIDTTFEWTGRAKAMIRMPIVLSTPKNIPNNERLMWINKKSLKILMRAKHFRDNLNKDEINLLYKQIINILQQLKKNAEARNYYLEWQHILNQNRKGN